MTDKTVSNPKNTGTGTDRPAWQKPTLTDLSITSTQGGTSTTTRDGAGAIDDYKVAAGS